MSVTVTYIVLRRSPQKPDNDDISHTKTFPAYIGDGSTKKTFVEARGEGSRSSCLLHLVASS